MKCPICGGEVTSSTTNLQLVHKGKLVVIENVPAKICKQCGEEWIEGKVSKTVDKLLEKQKEPKRYFLTPAFSYQGVAA